MAERRRWFAAMVGALAAAGAVAFTRGRNHHRGDDVGAAGDDEAESAGLPDASDG